jgi:large repetitive protein
MSFRRAARAALLALVATLAVSATALGATTTLGPSDLSPAGASSSGVALTDSFLVNLGDSSGSFVVTTAGTITTLRIAAPTGGVAKLVVVRFAGFPDVEVVSSTFGMTYTAGLNTFSTSLAVEPGDLVGLVVAPGSDLLISAADPGASARGAGSLAIPGQIVTTTFLPGIAMYNVDEELAPIPAPVVGGLSASSGSTAGGETLTITGASFSAGSAVTFGGVPAMSTVVDRYDRITVVAPPHAPGPVEVRVTTPSGTSASVSAGAYTYVAPTAPPVPATTPATAAATAKPVAPAKKPAAKKKPAKRKKKKPARRG